KDCPQRLKGRGDPDVVFFGSGRLQIVRGRVFSVGVRRRFVFGAHQFGMSSLSWATVTNSIPSSFHFARTESATGPMSAMASDTIVILGPRLASPSTAWATHISV